MPDLIADALDCVGERLEDWLDARARSTRSTARTTRTARRSTCKADADAMADEVERVCGPGEAAGYRRFVDFVTKLYRYEMRDFIDRNIDSPLDLLTPNLARLVGDRRLPAGSRRRSAQYLQGPAHAAGLLASSRCTPASPRTTRWPSTRSSPTWTPSPACTSRRAACTRCRGRWPARRRSTAWQLRYGTDGQPGRGRATAARSASTPPTASGSRPTSSCSTPTCRWPTASCCRPRPRRAGCERLRYSPSCFLLLAGSTRGYTKTAHHNIHFGRSWRGVFDELIDRQAAHERPVAPGHQPDAQRPVAGAATASTSTTCCSRRPTSSAGIDWDVVGPRYRDEVRRRPRGARLRRLRRRASRSSDVTTPADWQRRGMDAGRAVRRGAHVPADRPVPADQPRAQVENVVFAGSGTQPGVGVPMVLVSGRLAAERILGKDPAYRSRALRLAAPTAGAPLSVPQVGAASALPGHSGVGVAGRVGAATSAQPAASAGVRRRRSQSRQRRRPCRGRGLSGRTSAPVGAPVARRRMTPWSACSPAGCAPPACSRGCRPAPPHQSAPPRPLVAASPARCCWPGPPAARCSPSAARAPARCSPSAPRAPARSRPRAGTCCATSPRRRGSCAARAGGCSCAAWWGSRRPRTARTSAPAAGSGPLPCSLPPPAVQPATCTPTPARRALVAAGPRPVRRGPGCAARTARRGRRRGLARRTCAVRAGLAGPGGARSCALTGDSVVAGAARSAPAGGVGVASSRGRCLRLTALEAQPPGRAAGRIRARTGAARAALARASPTRWCCSTWSPAGTTTR